MKQKQQTDRIKDPEMLAIYQFRGENRKEYFYKDWRDYLYGNSYTATNSTPKSIKTSLSTYAKQTKSNSKRLSTENGRNESKHLNIKISHTRF